MFQGKSVNEEMIKTFLEDVKHFDPDNRFMAYKDLQTLIKEFSILKTYPAYEEKLKNCFLEGLDDTNMNVKGVANSCLIAAVTEFSEGGVVDVIRKMCKLMDKNQKADQYAIFSLGLHDCMCAMKTEGMNEDSAGVRTCADIIIPSMLTALQGKVEGYKQADIERNTLIRCREMLNVISTGLDLYGPWCTKQWDPTFDALKPLMAHDLEEVRTSARRVCGTLVNVVDEKVFTTIMEYAIEFLGSGERQSEAISLISTICRFAESRVGDYLDNIVPTLLTKCQAKNPDETEMMEACLQAFGTMFLRCPAKLSDKAGQIIDVVLDLISWDPNYEVQAVEEEVEDEDEDDDDDWGDDDEGEDGGWDDDDDGGQMVVEAGADTENTWKVRRACAKVLAWSFETRPQERKSKFDAILGALLQRLDERDPRCKREVIATLTALVETCSSEVQKDSSMKMVAQDSLAMPPLLRQRSMAQQLMGEFDVICSKIVSELANDANELDTTLLLLTIAKKLLDVAASTGLVNGSVMQGFEDLNTLFPALQKICENEEALGEAVNLLSAVVILHQPVLIVPHVGTVAEIITSKLEGKLSNSMKVRILGLARVTFESLNRCKDEWAGDTEKVLSGMTGPMFVTLDDLDASTEAKSAAVRAMGTFMARFGSNFKDDFSRYIGTCVKRLDESIVPVAVLRAIEQIANSTTVVDVAGPLLKGMAPYIQKKDANLRRAAASALSSVISACDGKAPADQFYTIILNVEDAKLISPAEPKMAEALFVLFGNMFSQSNLDAKVTEQMMRVVTGDMCEFLASPLVMPGTLRTATNFLGIFSKVTGDAESNTIRQHLYKIIQDDTKSVVVSNVAKSVAAVTTNQGEEAVFKVVGEKAKALDNIFALDCVGEIGSLVSLKKQDGLAKQLVNVMSTDKRPDVRQAAATSFGLMCSGDMATYVSFLLTVMQENTQVRALTTESLRQMLKECSGDPKKFEILRPDLGKVKVLLTEQAATEDEHEQIVIGDCLGRLATLDESILNDIVNNGDSEQQKDKNVRTTMLIALKYAIEYSVGHDNLQNNAVSDQLFDYLEKEKVEEARTALMDCLYLLLTTKAEYVQHEIPRIEELVEPGCKTNEALVKRIAIGSMQHVVDGGLKQRKKVYQIMKLLQAEFHFALKANGENFFKALSEGFSDENEDIQQMAFGIVNDCTEKRLPFIVNHLNKMKGPMTKGAKMLLKRSKIQGAEGSRAQDQTREITHFLWKTRKNITPNSEAACRDFCNFYVAITKTKQLKAYIEGFESS